MLFCKERFGCLESDYMEKNTSSSQTCLARQKHMDCHSGFMLPSIGTIPSKPQKYSSHHFFPKLWMLPLEHWKVQFHQMICKRGHAGVTSSTKFSIILTKSHQRGFGQMKHTCDWGSHYSHESWLTRKPVPSDLEQNGDHESWLTHKLLGTKNEN